MKPVILCILDGWGYRAETAHNAVALAHTPHFDRLWASAPRAFLSACGEDVGLPAGQMGNSEVGHLNLGAGRVVYQDLPRIDRAFAQGALENNAALLKLIAALKQSGGRCHLMGLTSPGGVHAHQNHIVALAARLSRAGVPVRVHAFLDGRDVAPESAAGQIQKFAADVAPLPGVELSTLCGRYYAMDRDKRWERVEKACRLLTEGAGAPASDPVAAIRASYAQKVTDEFVLPVALNGYDGMRDGDAVLFANFRADRARQILTALLDPAFDGFTRTKMPRFAAACGMVTYSDALAPLMDALFAPQALPDVLGAVLARAGVKQIRCAETEKYPHVTYFFNGGVEEPYAGEMRLLVPSPKVATYDLQPEMSAAEVTRQFTEALRAQKPGFALINFANPDMVGHTGHLAAAIRAVEAVDHGLGEILRTAEVLGARVLVTADHGNCEQMWDDATNGPHTAHTLNPVPLLLAGGDTAHTLRDGRLADIAPTVLALLGIAPPASMSGQSLLAPAREHAAAE